MKVLSVMTVLYGILGGGFAKFVLSHNLKSLCKAFSPKLRLFSVSQGREQSIAQKKVVFLGSPTVAAESLRTLHEVSQSQLGNNFNIVAVVTQPPAPAGRNNKLKRSPVHDEAGRLQLPVFTPESAKDPEFLTALEALNIDLCITAAYGNFLPKKFLTIPKFGTVNIHPSLLPLYRGAAPVQRCLEKGDAQTGVTVLFTVLKMDAGPMISQTVIPLNGDEKASDLLTHSFQLGTNALISALPNIFAGTVQTTVQVDENATAAPKISVEENIVDFQTMSAQTVHNKCRAFSDWPGIICSFMVGSEATEMSQIKLITTHVLKDFSGLSVSVFGSREVQFIKQVKQQPQQLEGDRNGSKVEIVKDMLVVTCGDGSVLGISELQPPGKKIMSARDFMNGMRGSKKLQWVTTDGSKQ